LLCSQVYIDVQVDRDNICSLY